MSNLKVVSPPPARDRTALHITSETAPLRQVILHTPGPEMELVSPENREYLLFEDILFTGHARKEHALMAALFEKVIGRPDATLQIATLLREAFASEAARAAFVEGVVAIDPSLNLQAFEGDLKRLSPEELHRFALTGTSPLPLNAQPLPNLMFTRDVAAVVHDRVVLSHPATSARAREGVITNVVFRHHPRFADAADQIIQLPAGVTFEGGDLLVASPEVVIVGHSERTSFGGIMALAKALFEQTSVRHVLTVDLPKVRFCMHLDTVFTFVTPDECVYFPPLFSGRSNNIVHFERTDEPSRFLTRIYPTLKNALEELLERPLTFLPCGGNDPLSQRREQWTDGANFFAIAPGVVVGYERNRETFDVMASHGYRVVSARGFLSYYEESDYEHGEKVAIKLEGNELSRGRGGPRCMTLPLARADV